MPDFELIVVDDCSEDSCPSILAGLSRDKRLKVIRNKDHLGLTLSLNRGLSSAKGKYIARLDSDDMCHPERLSHQIEFIEQTGVKFCAGVCSVINEEGKCLYIHRPPMNETSLKWLMLFRNPIRHSTVMWSNDHSLYDPSYTYSQDYELWSRFDSLAILDLVVAAVRTHPKAISSQKLEQQERFASLVTQSIVKKYLRSEIDVDTSLNLRALCIHKHVLQHERLKNMTEDDFDKSISIYMELLHKFVEEERPDISILRGEVTADFDGIVASRPDLRDRIERIKSAG
jgi:glycosyltransferase involved in cell wall biosynthesis